MYPQDGGALDAFVKKVHCFTGVYLHVVINMY